MYFHTITTQLIHYAKLMRLHKPIGTLLLLWPTLWALWIANQGWPGWKLFLIFTLGTLVMRSAGCIINDVTDRNFDGHVKRTALRPLVTGEVSVKQALILFGLLLLLAFLLVLQLNLLSIILAFLGLALTVIYPFMKRYTQMPQAILGLAFAWGIPMAFAASSGYIPTVGWQLFAATLLWIIAYDTLYAMVDREDDLKIGVKSTAILFGDYDRLLIGILQSAVILILAVTGIKLSFGTAYYIGLLVASGLFIYQQFLIRTRQPEKCFQAFLNNHWVGLAVFLGVLLSLG